MYLRFTVIMLLLVVLGPTSAYAETKAILGPGASTCGKWTQARKTEQYPAQLGWALGFISAYNNYMNTNVFGNSDTEAIAGWIDNYCVTKPLDTVYNASVELVKELDRRVVRR
jgi:hypothetical protein